MADAGVRPRTRERAEDGAARDRHTQAMIMQLERVYQQGYYSATKLAVSREWAEEHATRGAEQRTLRSMGRARERLFTGSLRTTPSAPKYEAAFNAVDDVWAARRQARDLADFGQFVEGPQPWESERQGSSPRSSAPPKSSKSSSKMELSEEEAKRRIMQVLEGKPPTSAGHDAPTSTYSQSDAPTLQRSSGTRFPTRSVGIGGAAGLSAAALAALLSGKDENGESHAGRNALLAGIPTALAAGLGHHFYSRR